MEYNKKFALVLFVLSTTIILGSAVDAYAAPSGDIRVCLNNINGDCVDDGTWDGKGNLAKADGAAYEEGESIPIIIDITGVTPNTPQKLIIDWDITKPQGGITKHTFDFITSFDRNDNPDPCFLPDFSAGCLSGPGAEIDIPTPKGTTTGTQPDGTISQPDTTFDDVLGDAEKKFKMFVPSGSITITGFGIIPTEGDPGLTTKQTTQFFVDYTTSATHVIAAFGVHIASSEDWVNAASTVNGLGFRVGCVSTEVDGAGGCAPESINVDADVIVTPPGTISIADKSQPEGDGNNDMLFTISRTGGTTNPVN